MVHVLLRTRKPSSQSREQDDHGPHAAQPPLRECGDVLPLRKRSSTRAAEGRWAQRPQDWGPTLLPQASPAPAPGCPTAPGRTIGVAGSGSVGGAGPGLHPPLAELQAVRVRQRRATREAEALLLARAALGHVHGQPGCPGCVAPHFGAGLRVARLELLKGEGGFRAPWPADFPAPGDLATRPGPLPSRSLGRSCHSHRSDGATARHLHSCCCTCSRSPRKPRRWAQGKVCFHYRTWGGRRRVTLGRGTTIPRLEDAPSPPPCGHS